MTEVRPFIRKLWEEGLKEEEEKEPENLLEEVEQHMGRVVPASGQAISERVGGSFVKAPEQQVGGDSILGRVFDVLSRGEYASANIAKDYVLGKPFDS